MGKYKIYDVLTEAMHDGAYQWGVPHLAYLRQMLEDLPSESSPEGLVLSRIAPIHSNCSFVVNFTDTHISLSHPVHIASSPGPKKQKWGLGMRLLCMKERCGVL